MCPRRRPKRSKDREKRQNREDDNTEMGVLLIIPIAGAMAIRSHKRMEECFAPSIFLIITVLYFSGIVTTFLPGLMICAVLSVATVIYIIVETIHGKADCREYIMTPGFAAFLLYFMLALIACHGFHIWKSDEFGHWALAIKNYYAYDDFSNIGLSTDIFGTYQPAATLWCYFCTKLWVTYSEGVSMLGQIIFIVSLILPVFVILDRGQRKWAKETALFIIIPCCVYISPIYNAFSTLYVDFLLGCAGFFCVWNFYRYHKERDTFYAANFCAGLFILALVKEFGIVLSGCIIAGIFIEECITRKRSNKTYSMLIALLLKAICAVIAAAGTWYGYLAMPAQFTAARNLQSEGASWRELNTAAVGKVFAAGMTAPAPVIGDTVNHTSGLFGKIMEGLSDPELVRETVWAFVRAMNDPEKSGGIGHLLPISTLGFLVLIIFYLLYRVKIRSDYDIEEMFDTDLMAGTLIAAALYYCAMLLAYLTMFNPDEVLQLLSFERYIWPATFVLFGTVFFIMLDERKEEKRDRMIWLIVTAVIMLSIKQGAVVDTFTAHRTEINFWGVEHSDVKLQPGDKVLYLSMDDADGDRRRQFYYSVFPATSNLNDETPETTGMDASLRKELSDNLSNKLATEGYGYVYLDTVNASFVNTYGNLFEERDIKNGTFYRVNVRNEGVRLELIGE